MHWGVEGMILFAVVDTSPSIKEVFLRDEWERGEEGLSVTGGVNS